MSTKLLVLTPDGKQREIRIGDFDDVKELVIDYTTVMAANAQLKRGTESLLRNIEILADLLTEEQRAKAIIAINAPREMKS